MTNNNKEHALFMEIPDTEIKKLAHEADQYNKRLDSGMDPTEIVLTGPILLQLATLKKNKKIK